jgi:glutathione S-transferase
MLKILGKPTSINVRKVLWTCAELNLTYQLEAWGDGKLATNAPPFIALNPNAMVPVLVDHATVLWESNTICRYLCAEYGDGVLLPPAPRRRALVEQWMDWQATELNTAWRYAYMALVRRSGTHADERQVAASCASWNRLLGIHRAGPVDQSLADDAAGASRIRGAGRVLPAPERARGFRRLLRQRHAVSAEDACRR